MALRGVTLHGPLHPIEKGVKNFLSLGFSVTKTYKINGNLPPKMSSSYSILLISETLEKGGQIFPVPVIFFRPNDNLLTLPFTIVLPLPAPPLFEVVVAIKIPLT